MSGAIDILIDPKIEAYKAEMMKMPGITQDAVNRSAEALRKSMYAAEAKKLAGITKDVGTSAKGMAAEVEGAGRVLKAFGGPAGQSVEKLANLAKGLGSVGEAVGPVGIGIGLAGTAAIGAALGFAKMADEASAAAKDLEKLGRASEIDPQARASVIAYDEATKDLHGDIDVLTTKAGGPATRALAMLGTGLHLAYTETVGVADQLIDLAQTPLNAAIDGFDQLTEGVLSTTGASEDYAGTVAGSAKETAGLVKVNKDDAETMERTKDLLRDIAAGRRANAAAIDAMALSMSQMAKEAIAAEDAEAKLRMDVWTDSTVAGLDNVEDAIGAAADALTDLGVRFDEWADRAKARAQIVTDSLVSGFHHVADITSIISENQIQGYQDEATAAVDAAQKAGDAYAESQKKRIDQELEVGSISQAEYNERLKQINAEAKSRRHAADGTAKALQYQAVTAFNREKALQSAAAIVDAGRAEIALMAAFAYLGPGAFAAASAEVGLGLGVALAQIQSQSPPSFHDGGIAPDEIDAGGMRLRRSEKLAVLNQRAVENGAAEQVDAMNRAMPGGSSVRLVLAESGRAIGEAWLTEARRPETSLGRAVGSTRGVRTVYGRG